MNNTQTNSVNSHQQMIGVDDSMQGMFNSGDAVLVDASVRSFHGDAVYAFRVGKNKYIASLQSIPDGGILVLPRKDGYQNWTITDDMNFEIAGRIIKGWRGQNV